MTLNKATIVGACLAAVVWTAALAEQHVGVLPPSPPVLYRHDPGRPGEELSQLCRTLDAHYRALGPAPENMCTISLPSSDEFRRPTWRPLDPAAHLDAIKEAFFWEFLDAQVNNDYYTPEHRAFIENLERVWPGSHRYRFEPPKQIDPALIEQAWTLFGAPAREMMAAGELRLETADFDINFDGAVEPVYRMTSLSFLAPDREETPQRIHVLHWPCDAAAGRTETHPFVLFVRNQDAPDISAGVGPWESGTRGMILHLNDMFWYRGRPYVVWVLRYTAAFVVYEPQAGAQEPGVAGNGFFAKHVCQFGSPHAP